MTEEIELMEQAPIPDQEAQGVEVKDDSLSRAVVSKIVERERLKALEKGKEQGRKEALMELNQQAMPQQQLESMAQPQGMPQQQAQPQSLGGMQQLSQADIERLISEKAPQLMQQQMQQLQQQQMVNSFVSKMQAAEAKYPGLEAKLNELDYSNLAPVVQMANELDNTGDIMKELVDNPEKMSNLILLAYTQPKIAQRKMMDLSNSIKINQQALAQEKEAQNPLSQLKPSTSAGMDNSAMSVSDFRKIFR